MAHLYRIEPLGFRLAAGGHVLAAEEAAAIVEADALIAAARAEAAAIVEDARRVREDERQRGYEEGLAQAAIAAAERLLDESRVLDEGLRTIEQDLTRVVVASVRKLVGEFDDRERAESVVRAALRQMRREKRAELRVGPAHFAHFRDTIGAIIKEFPEIELVDVVEDGALDGTHGVVETPVGRVDADFNGRLDDLAALIRRVAGAGEPEEATAP